MAATEQLAPNETTGMALPGMGRALVTAGKLPQTAAEEIYRKAKNNRTSFMQELTHAGAVSSYDLAQTLSKAFSVPLLDLDAIDPHRLPKRPAPSASIRAVRVESRKRRRESGF